MKSIKPKIIKFYMVFTGWSRTGKFLIKYSEERPTEQEVKNYIKNHLHEFLLPEIDLTLSEWILVPSQDYDDWGVWDLRNDSSGKILSEWATISEWDPETKELI